jgi:antitoxin CptB
MRRGIKEMDLILSRFAQARLHGLDAEDLDRYEALLDQNDQDLYQWVSGQTEAPAALAPIVKAIVRELPETNP